jgi:hypothetical protein
MKNLMALGMLLVMAVVGCSTAQKARRDEREKVAQSRGVYCDFVSESDFKDVDIELNLRMAKKCNVSKPFSISGYKRISENPGVLYCCNSEGVASEVESPAVKPAAPAAGKQGE